MTAADSDAEVDFLDSFVYAYRYVKLLMKKLLRNPILAGACAEYFGNMGLAEYSAEDHLRHIPAIIAVKVMERIWNKNIYEKYRIQLFECFCRELNNIVSMQNLRLLCGRNSRIIKGYKVLRKLENYSMNSG